MAAVSFAACSMARALQSDRPCDPRTKARHSSFKRLAGNRQTVARHCQLEALFPDALGALDMVKTSPHRRSDCAEEWKAEEFNPAGILPVSSCFSVSSYWLLPNPPRRHGVLILMPKRGRCGGSLRAEAVFFGFVWNCRDWSGFRRKSQDVFRDRLRARVNLRIRCRLLADARMSRADPAIGSPKATYCPGYAVGDFLSG